MKPFNNSQLHNPNDEEVSMSPLIDAVFLLLIYFMVTTTLLRSEADLAIRLPSKIATSEAMDMPDEQIIEINADGEVILNGVSYSTEPSQAPGSLLALLVRFREAAEAARTDAMITISADDSAKQGRVIEVLDICAAARIKNVTFSM